MKDSLVPDIEKEISELLRAKNKDYLTVNQIRGGLPSGSRKHLGLRAAAKTGDIIKALRPYLGNALQEYQGPRYKYIGFRMSDEEILVRKIRQTPGISSKQLRKDVPIINRKVVETLNALFKTGRVAFHLREQDHVPLLEISDKAEAAASSSSSPPPPPPPDAGDDISAFKAAYEEVGQGRRLVYIHRIREHLNWPQERFDQVLRELRNNYTIQLQGGDPSIMTEAEIRNSFVDERGNLHISLSWRKRP